MHSDFSFCLSKLFAFAYFFLFIINSFEHIFHIFTLMIELRNSSNTSKKKISEWTKNKKISKQNNVRERQKQRRILFSKKRQHERTSNSNAFHQNHKIRKQKENIERQRISNIKATINIKTTTNIKATTESEIKKTKTTEKEIEKRDFRERKKR